MSSSSSSRASRALALEVELSEVSSSGDRLLLAKSCLDILNSISDEVGVYGNVLKTLGNHVRGLIFCRTDYTIIPQKKVAALSSLLLRTDNNQDSNDRKDVEDKKQIALGGKLHNKPFYEITEQLMNSLIVVKSKLNTTKNALRASLEQRKMVVAEKESIARTLRKAQYDLAKSREAEQQATVDLTDLRRDTKAKVKQRYMVRRS